MENIYGKTLEELKQYFKDMNEKEFKAQQVYEWIYKKRIKTFDEMSNIKKEVIYKIKQDFSIESLKSSSLHSGAKKTSSPAIYPLINIHFSCKDISGFFKSSNKRIVTTEKSV